MSSVVTIQIHRDTAANWTSINPVLAQGEPGLETDTGLHKFGDGSTAWASLSYAKLPQSVYDAVMPWTVALQLPSVVLDPAVVAGTWVMEHTNTSLQVDTIENSSLALNDQIGWDIALAAGTWDFALAGVKASSAAIVTVALDGTTIATDDMYNASTTLQNVVKTTGISVSTNGKHRVTLTAASKNASSSGYLIQLSSIMFKRTA